MSYVEVMLRVGGFEYDSYSYEPKSRAIMDCVDSFKVIPEATEDAEIFITDHHHARGEDCTCSGKLWWSNK